jgi:hypothetical protein
MKVRRGFWWLLGLAALALGAFWGINRIDAPSEGKEYSAADLAPAAISPDNGYFRLVNLLQPPEADLTGAAVRAQTRRLFEPAASGGEVTGPSWNLLQPDQRLFLIQMRLPVPRLLEACARDRAALDKDLMTFRYVLARYERMLDCPGVADFTPPDPRSPVVPLVNTRGAARLWLAWAAGRGLDGDWPGAVAMVQAHIQFSQKLVAGSRGVMGSMIGMALTADGLQVLAEMINQPGFTAELGPGIEAGLPPWGGRELPLRNALLGEVLMVRQILRDPGAFQADAAGPRAVHSVSRFFTYQPNRTEGYLRNWADGLEAALDQPPFRRPPLPEIVFSGETAWWLQNGYGKSLAETSLPNATELHQRVYILLAWRDLVALAGRWRGSSGLEAAPAAWEADLAASGRVDPFSGRTYRYSQTRQCLYSVAENMADDGGDPRQDLIVPFLGSPGSAR